MTFDPMYCKCNKWSDRTYWEAKDGDGDANWGEVVLSVGATIGALHPVVGNNFRTNHKMEKCLDGIQINYFIIVKTYYGSG